jgi:uncharacterized protein with beta-barrel porin domain
LSAASTLALDAGRHRQGMQVRSSRAAPRGGLKGPLLRSAAVLALSAAALPASAQSWNYYNGYTNSAFVPFVDNKAMSLNQAGLISLSLPMNSGSTTTNFTMDTGSTGIAASADYFKPPAGSQPIMPGQIVYTSSNKIEAGYWYMTSFSINGADGKPVATAQVPVLQVLTVCPTSNPNCGVAATGVAFMGVGFGRGNGSSVLGNTNPFLGLTSLASGQPVSSLRAGYIIVNNGSTPGVQLGITGTATQNFSVVQLQPNGTTPAPGCTAPVSSCSYDWTTPPATVQVNNRPSGSGTLLPDTGVSYMLLTPPAGSGLTRGQNAPTGTLIQIWLPGQQVPLASYNFTVSPVPPDPTNPLQPDHVQVDFGSDVFINASRTFFGGFNYYYDAAGGFVGYQATSSFANFTPALALSGSLALQNGFATTYPLYLYGDSTFMQTGTGTFSGPISGLGNSLTIASGSLLFNGAIDMGGGNFLVQSGATATINSSLATGGLTNSGTLINNGAIQSTGGLTNSGTLTNNGAIQSTGGALLVNQGTLTNNGLLSSNVLNSGSLFNNGSIVGNVLNGGLLANNGVIQGAIASTGVFTGSGVVIGNFANGGVLNSNGTFVGNFVNAGFLGGNPTIVGSLANNGTLSPGNSIGTITVTGSAALGSGTTYNVEVNNAGQSDTIAVSGNATIQGGTVAVSPGTGVYAPRTTYTILSSSGLSGSFGSVSSSGSQFLLPSLSYDANNAYLTMTIGGFLATAQNPVQAAVGGALDGSVLQASGDYAQVLGNLAASNPSQVPAILTSLSGMNYSGFSNSMAQTAQLFMSNFSDMAGGSNRTSKKVALAEACDVACDTTEPAKWGAWGGGLGGLGTVGSGSSLGGVTYNVGGFAGGLDRRFTDNFLAGVTLGYTTGSQWVSGFSGQGFSNTVDVGLYGNWLQGPIYLDGIVGYAYSANQLNRSVNIPGMAGRTAVGQAGANQAYGQVEGGYRVDIGGNAEAYVTPFGRLQGYTGTQGAFTESGAQSLNLNVAAQTTNSLRTVLGAQLGGAMNLGWRDKLLAQLRLGWSHEYADTTRPVSVSFVGAPASPFTTYGVSPTRDGAVVGFTASTAVADGASLYARYEGNIAGQDSSHALTAGVRVSW